MTPSTIPNHSLGRRRVFTAVRLGLLSTVTFLSTDPLSGQAVPYAGREGDAAWRTEARARINAHRKREVRFVFKTPDGQPVPGVRVRLRQIRSAFPFGSQVELARFADLSSPENRRYDETFQELFNAASPGDALAWSQWDLPDAQPNHTHRATTSAALQHLAGLAEPVPVFNQSLLTASAGQVPVAYHGQVEAADPGFLNAMHNHITDLVDFSAAAAPGASGETGWIVLDQPLDQNWLMQYYGDAVMIEAFQRAGETLQSDLLPADTEVPLYINERGILSADEDDETRADAYEQTIRTILNGGGPLTGIGFSGHFDDTPPGIPRVWERLERFHQAFPAARLRVTDFEIATDDEELQADYLRDFITLAFSHPQVGGITLSGFWAGNEDDPRTALLRPDWEEKPAALAYQELRYGEFMTDLEGHACECGFATFRGFQGAYEYEIHYGSYQGSGVVEIIEDVVRVFELDVPVDTAPRFVVQPMGRTAAPGDTVTLSVVAAGFPEAKVTWFRDGVDLGRTGRNLVLSPVKASTAGKYQAVATNPHGSAVSRTVMVAVQEPGPQTGRLSNLSTRSHVGAEGETTVAGFVIVGNSDAIQHVVIRGVGPRLTSYGLLDALADPQISVFQGGTNSPLVSNDDWSADLQPEFARIGAFDLADDHKSSALDLNLVPGAYTVHLTGAEAGSGIALAEIYDAATDGPGRLINLSTRGHVGNGSGKLVAGFVILGDVPQRFLVRGIGPALEQFGVEQPLADPFLELFEALPDGSPRLLATNDDWTTGGFREMRAADQVAGAFPLALGSADAAMVVWLEPGNYTAVLSGENGGTGTALVEVYHLP